MGPCIVLFCFLWQAWQSKRLFSSCPHTPVCLNINLSHRIWFLPAQPVHSSEASIVKRLKVSQILRDVRDPVDHQQMAMRERRSEHSLPGTVLHDVRYWQWLQVETGNQYDSQCFGYVPGRNVIRQNKNFHLLPMLLQLWTFKEGCRITHELLPSEYVQTQIWEYERVLPKWELCSHGNYLSCVSHWACVWVHLCMNSQQWNPTDAMMDM